MSKYVLLTGVTGHLGGYVLAKLLDENYSVIITSRSAPLLQKIVERQKVEKQKQVIPRILDLSNMGCVNAFNRWIKQYEIYAFICCSGIDDTDSIEQISEEDLILNLRVNYISPAMIIKQLFVTWKNSQVSGKIINISSLLAIRGLNNSSIYGGSKAALESFIRNIAMEGANLGIVANSIRVSATGTSLIKKSQRSRIVRPEIAINNYELAKIPTSNILDVDDVTSLIEVLLKQKNGITGQSINADCGLSVLYPNYRK